MKNMSKLMSLVLAVAMLLSMAMMVSADGTGGTIVIEGSGTNTYTVYKMFDIETANGGNKYKITAEWEAFANNSSVETFFEVRDGYVFWKKATTSKADAAALAELAKLYVTDKNLTSDKTVAVGGSITVPDDGYYLLASSDESASGVTEVQGGETVTIKAKTEAPGLPNVSKEVKEDSNNKYQSFNSVDVGQVIEFQTTITAAAHSTKYVLHDKMDEHIEFTGITGITRDGNTMAEGTDYNIVLGAHDGCSECDFHVVFTDSACNSFSDGASIVVQYTGKLKEGAAEMGAVGHENVTWLTHTEQKVKTNEASTLTYTFNVEVIKKDDKGAPLTGAGFVLKDNVGKFYKWDNEVGQVKWVATEGEATELFSEMVDGVAKVTFYGVDAENFTVVEKTVPGGYTGVSDTVASTKNDPSFGKNASVTVVNTLGTQLPETGGIGTTVFYIAGGLMVLAAAALLLTKKRASA